jgi:hypothetical protein
MREKSIRCLSTIGRRCYLIRIGVTNNEGKKEKKMMKHNKKQEQQKHSTTSNNNSLWCITTDRYMCVRLFRGAGCLVIVMMIFFFYFSFLLFSILSGVHAGTFYMTSRGRIWKKKADKIQLSRESFDRSRLEVESNSKSCETVNWTNPRM